MTTWLKKGVRGTPPDHKDLELIYMTKSAKVV